MTWTSMRLRRLIRSTTGGTWGAEEGDGEIDVACVRAADFSYANLTVNPDRIPMRSISRAELRPRQLHEGDLIIEKSGGGEQQPVGRVVRWNLDRLAVCSNFAARIEPKEGVSSRFLTYLFSSLYAAGITAKSIKQTTGIQNLDVAGYLNEIVRVPSGREQQAIANFLDAETFQIDAIIQKKRRLSVILSEHNQRIVLDAIRGAREPGSRRASGLNWLGAIPSSWPALTANSQFEILLGKMLDERRITGEHLRPYLRNTNVQWGTIRTDDLLYMDFAPHERERFRILAGDLLVCEGGEPGRAAIWQGTIEEIYYQKALHRCRSRGQSIAKWLFYCLRAATSLRLFAAEGNTTTIAHLTGEQLRAQRFPFPDPPTQQRIVDRLDAINRHDRDLQRLLGKQIELLQERRRALITAAVTGKMEIPEVST